MTSLICLLGFETTINDIEDKKQIILPSQKLVKIHRNYLKSYDEKSLKGNLL